LTSLPLFQSPLLISSCINMIKTRRNFKHSLCSRITMHKSDIMVWVWNSAMYRFFNVRVSLPNTWRG
jgi:hypothetical protein